GQRRHQLVEAMQLIKTCELDLSRRLVEGLQSVKGLKIHGITNFSRLKERVPTVSFTSATHSPQAIAQHLAEQNIYVWDGHSYAVEVVNRLGLQDTGGVVRVGAVHYNTPGEIDILIRALEKLH
ncbi:MAG: aminotransferase class V-fold PLP-dependent enzyme, partial [Verrucomicrobiae bacterium]|nr:aminotransferase class V-fold PLP-dependent enzyme [Verrucomicrobiae bacterium]